MDGQEFYELHRDDVESYGIPRPAPWSELSATAKRGWECAAAEYVEKRLTDRKDTTP